MRLASFTYSFRLRGHSNARRHWRVELQEKKRIKAAVAHAWAFNGIRPPPGGWPFPLRITLTRIAPGTMDAHDNLPAALKYVVDEVARLLGLASDNGPEVAWAYGQEKAPPKTYAVRIDLETLPAAPDSPHA